MGFDHKHYVPILKAKGGELRALKEAHETIRHGMTPVLEVPDIPQRYLEGADDPFPSKSAEAHAKDVADGIAKAWGADRRVFVDGFYIETSKRFQMDAKPSERFLMDCATTR